MLVSLPLFSFAALFLGVPPANVPAAVALVLVIGALFFAAGISVRQRTTGRRLAAAGTTALGGVLVTIVMLAVVV